MVTQFTAMIGHNKIVIWENRVCDVHCFGLNRNQPWVLGLVCNKASWSLFPKPWVRYTHFTLITVPQEA